jgi:hypothetical protein
MLKNGVAFISWRFRTEHSAVTSALVIVAGVGLWGVPERLLSSDWTGAGIALGLTCACIGLFALPWLHYRLFPPKGENGLLRIRRGRSTGGKSSQTDV